MDVTFDQQIQTTLQQQAAGSGLVRPNDFGKLRREGLLVEMDVTGASIFVTSMEWSELGVNDTSLRTEWMSKGRKHVYPPEMVDRLKSCITKFRQMFKEHTRQIPGLPAAYLHYKRYQSFMDTWQRLSIELTDIREDLIAAHDEAIDRVAEQYTTIAHEAWNSATANGEECVRFGGEMFTDRDLFTDALVTRAISKVPDIERIEEKVQATYTTFTIQAAEDLLHEEARAARALAEARAEADRMRIENQGRQDELDHRMRLMALEEERKQAEINAMFHAEGDRIRAEVAGVTSPLEETFVMLRNELAESANELIGQIQKNGKLHGRSAKRALETLSALFEMRSIVDDRLLREKLAELRAAVGPVGADRPEGTPERSTEHVQAALEGIRDLVKNAREDYLQEPSRFLMLD